MMCIARPPCKTILLFMCVSFFKVPRDFQNANSYYEELDAVSYYNI